MRSSNIERGLLTLDCQKQSQLLIEHLIDCGVVKCGFKNKHQEDVN